MEPKIFIINKNIIEKCKNFSEEVIKTTDYSDSNQTNKDKEKLDHFVGKVGEYGAWYYLKSLGKETSEPDCNIYTNKSWQEDLLGQENYGVKTQSYSLALGLSKKFNKHISETISWTFQFGDKRKDTVFNNDKNNICFTLYVKKFKADADKVIVFPIKTIGEIIFSESLLDHVRSSKKIAYGKDNYKDFKQYISKFGL